MATSIAATERSRAAIETSRAATWSIASNATLTIFKIVAGLLTHSVSVLAEGIHSANDLLASLLAWFAIRKANEPVDEEHAYGHGKFESLSAAIEAGMIVAAALGVMWTAIARIVRGLPPDLAHGPALGVMAFSAIVNIIVSAYLFRVSKTHDSVALAADAWHLRADVWTSLGVVISLGLILITDWHILDPLAALLVGFLILFQGGKIGRQAVQQLLDHCLPREEMALIHDILAEHQDMFMEYHKLRTRKAGREREIDLHLVTCPLVTVEEAHQVAQHLEDTIEEHWPHTRVTIHIEPCHEQTCPNRTAGTRIAEACALRERTAAFSGAPK